MTCTHPLEFIVTDSNKSYDGVIPEYDETLYCRKCGATVELPVTEEPEQPAEIPF